MIKRRGSRNGSTSWNFLPAWRKTRTGNGKNGTRTRKNRSTAAALRKNSWSVRCFANLIVKSISISLENAQFLQGELQRALNQLNRLFRLYPGHKEAWTQKQREELFKV